MSDRPSILVAMDPSASPPDSTPVLALALSGQWKVHLVYAATSGDDQAAESALLTEQLAFYTDHGLDGEAHVMVGPPVDVVLAAAESLGASLIVVAGHRHTIDHRETLGSFTSALLKVADRPVLVLPSGVGREQAGFVAALDRLIELIDREVGGDELIELREAAHAQIRVPSSEEAKKHLGSRLTDSLHRFETDHPTLTKAINDVSYYLSGMGI